ncbi:PLD nuclease N-terminal domain-containing protein [Dactylosporangium sp. NPDC000521]|uniref:PLD nuclease N-terminal domain-containing protein n=1 Tax=Dactylosporangium sp. NPDC000521 TaxID=3363975 RepID=UPI0036B1198D
MTLATVARAIGRESVHHSRWSDLSTRDRTSIVLGAAAELTLTAIAAADLYRRPASQIQGPKALWWPALAIQPAGPLLYLLAGRRRDEPDTRRRRRH